MPGEHLFDRQLLGRSGGWSHGVTVNISAVRRSFAVCKSRLLDSRLRHLAGRYRMAPRVPLATRPSAAYQKIWQ